MNFKQFMEEATKRLQEKLGGGYTLEERTTDGLNSTTNQGFPAPLPRNRCDRI